MSALSRREALLAAGAAGVGAVLGVRGLLSPRDAAAASCLLQREVTEGPYYLDLDKVRRNIKGGRKGTPLTLRFQVVNATTCKPIPNAAVEIWHADAGGEYSGVEGNSGTWLRGIQRTGTGGRVRFETIFPGWYRGRTPHIHMKVFVSGDEVHTGQVFFGASAKHAVYAQGRYAARGQSETSNRADGIYRQAGSRAVLDLHRKASLISAGYTGSLVIGVNPSGGQ
jgi:protocatechuate 3,4-dioxygenase beta subunit